MALTQCSECQGEMSTLAKTCPKCGAPFKRKNSAKKPLLIVAALVSALIVLTIAETNDFWMVKPSSVSNLADDQFAPEASPSAEGDICDSLTAASDALKKQISDSQTVDDLWAATDAATATFRSLGRSDLADGLGPLRGALTEPEFNIDLLHKQLDDPLAEGLAGTPSALFLLELSLFSGQVFEASQSEDAKGNCSPFN